MQTMGLIGGLSWVATADYYRRMNEITNGRLGGAHSAPLVLASVDRELYVDAVIRRRDEDAVLQAGEPPGRTPKRAPDSCTAFLTIVAKTGCTSVGELEMTRRI